MSLQLPHPFGRYLLTERLGEGGMAEVYLAEVAVAEGLSKRVVIKKIRREFADQQEFTRMFVDEAKIALSLNHANIVQVFDFGQVRGDFYLAMEHVEGIDLMHLFHAVRRGGDAFPPVIAAYVGHQVAAALAYAHRKGDDFGRALGIVHRDISPHNVMVSFEGQVKILDFGIARTRESTLDRAMSRLSERLGRDGPDNETIKGKVAYMSPEQALGRPVDGRSDVYSLGVVLHELLTGQLLFRTKDRIAALERVRNESIPLVRDVVPECPSELADIVDRALARDPAARYEGARALQADLSSYLHRADPVVDDEVLSNFTAQYHRAEPPSPAPPAEEAGTHELGDSHPSAVPRRASRRQERVVVLLVAAEPHGVAPEDSYRRMAALVRDLAFKRGAEVLASDAGTTVLAFGTDLHSGDDAERALRTALALRDDAAASAPGLRLGLVVALAAAIVERDQHGGVAVELRHGIDAQLRNVAAAYLDGPVMVSGNLVDTLSGAWRFGSGSFVEPAPGDPGTASAIDRELEHVAPLLGPVLPETRVQSVPGGRGLLFGRELELKSLRDALADAIRSRRSRAVLVLGEPGVGKRALVERFVASLPRTACWVLRATGTWARRHIPFGVFVDLLARFLEVDAKSRLEDIEAKLERHGVADATTLAPVLAHALGADAGDAPDLEPGRRRDRLGRLVRRLVVALARHRPVLVVIENIHLHDERSIELLREWIERPRRWPILGLVTGRPGNRRVELVRRDPNVAVVQLRELDAQARRDLIVRRFEDPETAEALADAILAHTGGNPMFIELTLASLVERGVVGWNAGGRYLVLRHAPASIALPPSIEAALAERITEVVPEDREILQAAAVIGRHFRPGEVVELLQRSIEAGFSRLGERALLEPIPDARAGAETLRFPTVSLHEAARASTPPSLAEAWHGRAAELRRARADYAPERDDGPIADHLVAAGRVREAVEPALRAAAFAHDVEANVEAYHYLSFALRGLDDDDRRRFKALIERERILRVWGKRRAQGAEIRQILGTADRIGDPQLKATAQLRLLRFYLEAGRTHIAERLVPRVEAAVEALPVGALPRAVLPELRSELALALGRFDEAEAVARAGLSACGDDVPGRRQHARLLRNLAQAAAAQGQHEEAEAVFRRALDVGHALDDPRLCADIRTRMGEVAARRSHYQEALDHFRAALDIDRDLGDRFATGRKLANLGTTYAAIGLYRRAERYLRKALDLHEAVGHPAEFNDVIVHLGEVVASLGQLESARSLLGEAARVAQSRSDARIELRAKVRMAQALVDLGGPDDYPAARNLAEEVLARAEPAGYRTAQRRALAVLSRIAEHRGAITQAIADQREAVALVRAGADPIDGVRSIHHLGRLLVGHGDAAEGRALLHEAAAMIRARVEELRDEELRVGYLEQPEAATILAGAES